MTAVMDDINKFMEEEEGADDGDDDLDQLYGSEGKNEITDLGESN